MIHIGFTGTQDGMTLSQAERLRLAFEKFGPDVIFHHGDCIGADSQAHDEAVILGWVIHIHPPLNPYKRAFRTGHLLYPQKEYIERNHDIVDVSSVMFATPKETKEQLRSGTWATIRYSKKHKKKLEIIYP